MNQSKVKCPFCEGGGCCNCDHSGFVPYGEGFIFSTKTEAETHDPGYSYFDLQMKKGERDLDGKVIKPLSRTR